MLVSVSSFPGIDGGRSTREAEIGAKHLAAAASPAQIRRAISTSLPHDGLPMRRSREPRPAFRDMSGVDGQLSNAVPLRIP